MRGQGAGSDARFQELREARGLGKVLLVGGGGLTPKCIQLAAQHRSEHFAGPRQKHVDRRDAIGAIKNAVGGHQAVARHRDEPRLLPRRQIVLPEGRRAVMDGAGAPVGRCRKIGQRALKS